MTVDELLSAARSRLRRLDPAAAHHAVAAGAVMIDIRSERQRDRDGVIPGAVFVPRNVLEWRVDPTSGHADPGLGGDVDRHVILLCDEGYQSSLAAATLQQLGFHRATDVVGGFQAWRAARLPVAPVSARDRQQPLGVPPPAEGSGQRPYTELSATEGNSDRRTLLETAEQTPRSPIGPAQDPKITGFASPRHPPAVP
jgi:rhodanese-related sulfurtransferase